MRPRVVTSLLVSVLAAGVLTACGISDPYGGTTTVKSASTGTSATSATNADPAPERGGTIPSGARAAQSRVSAGAAQPTPEAALQRYAHLYVNWTAASVVALQRELASLSQGQARAQAVQAAASYSRDQTLAQSGVADSGRLIAITPNLTTPGQWVLVTSEQTTGKGDYSGLPPTLHVIYAQVTHAPNGWVISEWAPQD